MSSLSDDIVTISDQINEEDFAYLSPDNNIQVLERFLEYFKRRCEEFNIMIKD